MNHRRVFGTLLCSLFPLALGCASRTVVVIQAGPPPAWVDSLPKRSGTLCAVGYSGPTFYQTDCLKNAADNARSHLAESISVTIRTMTVDISDGTRGSFDKDVFVQGSESASNCVLQGSEVDAQWVDGGGQRGGANGCYSMVCIDPNKPIEKLVESLQDKKLPPKTVERVRANAAAAFEELEQAEAKVEKKASPAPPAVPALTPEETKPAEPPSPPATEPAPQKDEP